MEMLVRGSIAFTDARRSCTKSARIAHQDANFPLLYKILTSANGLGGNKYDFLHRVGNQPAFEA